MFNLPSPQYLNAAPIETPYIFTDAELTRLTVYRRAVRANYFNDGGASSGWAIDFDWIRNNPAPMESRS